VSIAVLGTTMATTSRPSSVLRTCHPISTSSFVKGTVQFQYVAYTGELGLVKGQVEASDEADATDQVVRQGYMPLKVVPARRLISPEGLFPSLFQVTTRDLIRFSREMATMLSSGGSLLRTLEMLQAEGKSPAMGRVLEDIRSSLGEGNSLSGALARHPKVFSPLFVSVVEVGEYTGRLGPALEQMAEILEKEHESKQKAIRTMMYPMAIIGLSIITLAVLMMVAMPPIIKIFDQMGTEVPLMTRFVVGLIGGINEHIGKIFLACISALGIFCLLRRLPRTRYWLDAVQAGAPLFGPFIVARELSRFSRTIAMLLDAGVPLSTALQLGISGCKNLRMRCAFADAEDSLMSGHGLADALKGHKILPSIFVELVLIGEESNSLQRTMSDAANTYQAQLERRLDSLLGMLEPASTVAVGAIVGIIAFSMFVPIYSGLNALE